MKILDPDAQETQQPVYDYTVTLTDATFRVVLIYRERQDGWYLDLFDAADAKLLTGKRLALDQPLLYRYQIPGLPVGELVLIDFENSGAECGYEDLGRRCKLVYFEPEDLPAAAASGELIISVV